jgi:hypothetical protein
VRSDWEARLSIGLGVAMRVVGVAEIGVVAIIGVVDSGDGIGELYDWSRSTYEVDISNNRLVRAQLCGDTRKRTFNQEYGQKRGQPIGRIILIKVMTRGIK